MTIGEKIRLKRKEKSLTLKELGELCGTHGEMIRQYEAGIRNPKIATLRKIAQALGVHGSYFLEVEQDDYSVFEKIIDMNYPTLKNYAAVLGVPIAEAIRRLEEYIPSEYREADEDTIIESISPIG